MARKLSAYQLHMKRALKGKMKGKTKAQRKAIFKAAAKSYRGGKSKPRTRTRSRSVSRARSKPRTRTKGTNPMAKRRGFLNTSTFMKFARLFALAAPAAAVAIGPGTPQDKIKEGGRIYTGFDMNTGQWSLANLAQGWLPYIGTALATFGISKIIGMIRRL
jgi:hypothetical protein